MRLLLAALLALGAAPTQAGPVVSGRVAVPSTNGVAVGNIRAAGATFSLPSVSLTASLSPSLSPALAPSLSALHAPPSLSADAAAVAPLQAAASVPSALVAPRSAPAGLAPASAAPAEAPKPGARQEGARESLERAAEKAAAPRQEEESAESGKASAGADFDGAAKKEGGAPVARGRWARRAGLGLLASGVLGGSLLVASDPTHAVPAPSVPESMALQAAAPGGPLHALGQAGYVVGNALAFVFPAFEIYRAYKTGSSAAMPKTRAALLIGSSLAVGLFVLTLSGLPVWAIQNIFGALALGVVWPSAWAARKLGVPSEGKGFSAKAAFATVATAAVTLGASAALYHLVAAPFVPMLVKLAFGASAIGSITLGIQVVAAAVQAFLFAPDLIKLYKGKAGSGGFSSGFTLALTLASLSFVVYSAVRVAGAPGGSTQMWQFVLYTGLYLLYTVTSGATWWLGRRASRKN